MGLGRFGGGVGAARFAVAQGAADVLVTDKLPESELQDAIAALEGLPIRYRLGEHRAEDFTQADLVIVNPAVDRRRNRYLQAAEQAGTAITSEIELLIERLPNRARTIGVTGTAGKSTVTTMIGHILKEAGGEAAVHVGGNIGGSLLPEVETIGRDDWVVLELSSFMLEAVGGWSPHIAVVTNLAANHLDRHGSLAAYAEAKKQILAHQRDGDWAILGEGVADWRQATRGRAVVVDQPVQAKLSIVGAHNALNAAMAVATCEQAGIDRAGALTAVAEFPGLPHRLQLVGEHAGRTFYNDSKCTTPDAAMLAIDSFPPGSAHVILGGYDKGSSFDALATHAARHCAGIYTIGATGGTIADAAEAVRGGCPVHRCEGLEAAVRAAVTAMQPGEALLLSPGCASWDQFEHYEQRGRAFAELVLRFTTETGLATH